MSSTGTAYREGCWSPAAAAAVPPGRSGTEWGTIRRGNGISPFHTLDCLWHQPFFRAVTEKKCWLKGLDIWLNTYAVGNMMSWFWLGQS